MSRQRHAGDFAGERAREMGRRGAAAAHAKRRAAKEVQPFAGTILDAMHAAGLTGASWVVWRVVAKAIFGLLLDAAELVLFQRHTGRSAPLVAAVKEAWLIIGRRGGKSRIAALVALFLAIRKNYAKVLAPGERGVIPVVASDRKQAGVVLGFLKGLARSGTFAPYVARVLKESVEFRTGVTVEVHAASYRSTRGYTVVGMVADELAFWRSDEDGANPDAEVLNALRPGILTIEGALLLVISSPYATKGELHRAHERSFGQDDPRVLVWNADTCSMNPTVDEAAVREAFEQDPVAAASEYGEGGRVVFRTDVQSLFDPQVIRAAMVQDRRELPYVRGIEYVAFADPSGGSADSFTLAIAHKRNEIAILDAIREVRPPFSPDAVCAEFAALLLGYSITQVTGDHYAGEWPIERFRAHGIEYLPSEFVKSDLYREALPLLNAGRAELLADRRLAAQLVALERRTSRTGKDTIDHPPGGHDDLANAACGALVLASKAAGSNLIYAGGRVMNLLTGEGFGDPWENA